MHDAPLIPAMQHTGELASPPAALSSTALGPSSAVSEPALLGVFVGEAEQQLETMTECLLALEAHPDGDHVQALLRALHALTSSAEQAGLARMAQVARAAAELLAALRQRRASATTDVIYVCLEAVDVMRSFLHSQKRNGSALQERAAAVLARLEQVASGAAASPAASESDRLAPAAGRSPAPPRLVRVLVDRLDNISRTVVRLTEARRQILIRLAELEHVSRQLRDAAPAAGAAMDGMETVARTLDRDLEDLARLTERLEGEIARSTMVPMASLYIRVTRTVREAAAAEGKRVALALHGGDTELDSRLLHVISDPLIQLVRNAIGHGIESPQERYACGKPEEAHLVVRASRQDGICSLEVEDDGRGLDFEQIRRTAVRATLLTPADAERLEEGELLRLLFEPGFSTRVSSAPSAEHGVGLDAVSDAVSALKGEIEVRTRRGAGARFTLRIPLQPRSARLLSPAAEASAAAPSASASAPPCVIDPESALSGDLHHVDLPGLVQMLAHSRQTGVLLIHGAVNGRVTFSQGELLHAECGALSGDAAVLRLIANCARERGGAFKFVPCAVSSERTVLRTANDLMLRALIARDESQRDSHSPLVDSLS